MSSLADFLLARIADDEHAARQATAGPWRLGGRNLYAGGASRPVVEWSYDHNGEHIARWEPERVLAECQAKRRIVERFQETEDEAPILRVLALPYAGHPGYRKEWRP